MQEMVAKYVLLLALALAAPASLAQSVAPDALLRAVAVEIIDNIKQDQQLQAVDPAKIAVLVETRIVPLFDFVHMTQLAVARNWRLATPEQQRVLTEEFKTLMVRTYSTALAHYSGEVIEVKPLRVAPLGSEVTVRSEVKQPGKERMTLDYEMEKTRAGWKIYDIKVAGVCLVTTYRDIFSEKVRDGGVDGLIKFLVDENRGEVRDSIPSRPRSGKRPMSCTRSSRMCFGVAGNRGRNSQFVSGPRRERRRLHGPKPRRGGSGKDSRGVAARSALAIVRDLR
jgi:phospholipid transport system substrate-binding protein